MSRFAKLPKPRTRADRERDLIMFLGMASPERIRAATPAELSDRYGVNLKVATIRHQAAVERLGL